MRSREPGGTGSSRWPRPTPAESAVPLDEESERLLRRYANEMDLRARLLDEMPDGILAHDFDGRVLYFNRAVCRRVGLTTDEFARIGPWGWVAVEMRDEIVERCEALRQRRELRFEAHGSLPSGAQLHYEIISRVIDSPYGEIILSVMRDITDRTTMEDRIRYLAFHDNLTDLANRALFEERLREALAHSTRRTDLVGVVFLDLDDFKPINDRFGHAAGDRALQVVADRLSSCVREGDTVARLGGDEFLVLFRRLAEPSDLSVAALKLVQAVSEPMSIDGETIRLSVSVGLAVHEPGESPEALVMRADNEMYFAKHEGLPGWEVFLRDV